MLSTMESIARCPKLFDATEPLEFFGIDQVINDLIINVDIIVNWVTKYFFIHKTIIANSLPFW